MDLKVPAEGHQDFIFLIAMFRSIFFFYFVFPENTGLHKSHKTSCWLRLLSLICMDLFSWHNVVPQGKLERWISLCQAVSGEGDRLIRMKKEAMVKVSLCLCCRDLRHAVDGDGKSLGMVVLVGFGGCLCRQTLIAGLWIKPATALRL